MKLSEKQWSVLEALAKGEQPPSAATQTMDALVRRNLVRSRGHGNTLIPKYNLTKAGVEALKARAEETAGAFFRG